MIAAKEKPNGPGDGGRRIAGNTLFNLAGVALPLVAALVAIPRLIDVMGTERFGILSLAWMVVGYFNFVEFGIGRAMTIHVAAWLAEGRKKDVGTLVGTGVLTTVLLGLLAGLGFHLIVPFIVGKVAGIPPSLSAETTGAATALAFAIPFVLPSLAMRGALQAHHRFDQVNLVRGLVGVATFMGPLAVLPFSRNLVPMVWALVAVRSVGFLLYATFLERNQPFLKDISLRKDHLSLLLGTGGWLVVSNIISPILVYLDRLIIARILGVAAIAYYFTSFEITTKALLLPASLAAVLFPVFSALNVVDDNRFESLYSESMKSLFIILFPVVLVLGVFAREILDIWVGSEYSAQGFRVMQILSLGVLANGLASIPFSCLQARGHAKTTAFIHLGELPVSLLAFYLLTREFGIAGAAFAWTLRVCVDGLVMHYFAARRVRLPSLGASSIYYLVFAFGCAGYLLFADLDLSLRILFTVILGLVHSTYYREFLFKSLRTLKSWIARGDSEAVS